MVIDGVKHYFHKENKTDKIYWLNAVNPDEGFIGQHFFSFDKQKVYNFFSDWDKLTPEQKEIFTKENPDLAQLK